MKTTSHAAEHLKKTHQKYGTEREPSEAANEVAATFFTDPKMLRRLTLEFILEQRLPFSTVESKSFQKLLRSLNSSAISKLPLSRRTYRRDAIEMHRQAQQEIIQHLKHAVSNIHLTFDLWTSPNCKAMLAVCGHWVSKDYALKSTLLALKQVHGDHSGENMAAIIHDVVKEFEIEDKLGYFVTDNVDSNDNAISFLNQYIQEEGGTGFDCKERRIRCFGHILNLAAKALLFGQKENKGKSKLDSKRKKTLEDQLREEASEWRALGAVGMLHNIVAWIRRTPKRREAYLNTQLIVLRKTDAFMLPSDNKTRWGSTATMIEAALKQKDAIQILVNGEADLKDEKLSDDDWKDLEVILQLLKPFKELTLYAEAKDSPRGSLGSWLPSVFYLLGKLESAQRNARASERGLKASIDLAWKKLDKYYKLSDDSIAYAMAVILNPRLKLDFLAREFTAEDIARLHVNLREKFEEYNELRKQRNENDSSIEGNTNSENDSSHMNIDNELFCSLAGDIIDDELDEYLKSPTLKIMNSCEFNPIEWWVANKTAYPTLAMMAFDFLSIPAMSAEPERVFSG